MSLLKEQISLICSKLLHNRCGGSTGESGQSMTLNQVVAASQCRGDADGGERLAVG
jgi:hypothetical protein